MKRDWFFVTMIAVCVGALLWAAFVVYAEARGRGEFQGWCHAQGGQVIGDDGDVCVGPDRRVIVP